MDVPLIKPPATFGPADHPTLNGVAQVAGSKILDCVGFGNVPMNLIEIATKGWKAPFGSVPRLAIVVQIDAWSVVKLMAPPHVGLLKGQGCDLRLFYARQLSAGHVHRWVLTGAEPGTELLATLTDLDTVWQGSAIASNVVSAMQELVAADTTASQPLYFALLSSVALKFETRAKAGELARAALKGAMQHRGPESDRANQIAMAVAQKVL